MIIHMPTDKNIKLENSPISPQSLLEQDRRNRREIANSNERRRMQSINEGFQSLRALLPHRKGEKLSKAAILQSTADYVFQLEQDKARLLEQNNRLSRKVFLSPHNLHDSDGSCSGSPLPKRRKRELADTIDEGIGSSSPSRSENGADDVKRELIDLRLQLDHERTVRAFVEQQLHNLEMRIYSTDGSHDESEQIHLQYPNETEDIVKSLNFGQESGLSSPRSQMSSQDMESSHEISLRGSSPDLSNLEAPEDLPGKNGILPNVDTFSISDTSIPGLVLSTSDISIESFPAEFDMTSQQTITRQNLETIVEAIRHVEGDHMFRDDPEPVQSIMQSRPGVIVSNLS